MLASWKKSYDQPSSVEFSRSVVSDSLQPHELQHTRPPCPSPTPGVHSDSCPSVRDAIQPSHPRSSPSPPAPNPSQHQSLSSESALHMRWPKYWSFSFSIIHSKEIPGLISFRMDWYSHLFQNFPQFIVIHTVKGFGIVNKAEIFFKDLLCDCA